MKKKLNIALVFDENYVDYACVTIKSLLKNVNSNSEITFLCINNDLSSVGIKKVEATLKNSKNEIIWINPDQKLTELSNLAVHLGRFPSIVWYKVFLPFILPKEIDEVLFIDTDILINGDISSFYHCTLVQMGKNLIACALDRSADTLAKVFNLDKYINSGVILYNCKRIRANWNVDDYMKFFWNAYNSINIIFPDQDIINIMFDSSIYLFDTKYNFTKMVDKEYVVSNKTEVKESVIIHFVGGEKPWNIDYCGPYAFKYLRYYYKYLSFRKIIKMLCIKIILKIKTYLLCK